VVAVDALVKSFPGGDRDIPPYFTGLPIRLPCDIEDLGGNVFRVAATYGPRAGQEAVAPGGGAGNTEPASDHGDGGEDTPVGPELSYSTTGGTQHITQSIKTRQGAKFGPAGLKPRDFGRGIGVNPQTGEFAGVDVDLREVKFSIKLQLPAAAVTGAWLKSVELATPSVHGIPRDETLPPGQPPFAGSGTVPANPGNPAQTFYLGYAEGEIKFLGVDLGNQGASGHFDCVAHYAVKRNQAELLIYSNPDNPSERLRLTNVHGWSHVWCTYKPATAVVDGKVVPVTVPDEAYEEQVYPYTDLRLLGLQNRRKKP